MSWCNGSGVVIKGAGNIIINSSITRNSFAGIEIWGSNNTVQWNRISANDDCGIIVYGDGNVIESNALLENVHDGMEIEGSSNLISGNNISMTHGAGIELLNMSSGNMVEGNTIYGNEECGIEVIESYENNIPHSALKLQSVVFFAFWAEQFDDLYGILVEVSDFLVFLAADPDVDFGNS